MKLCIERNFVARVFLLCILHISCNTCYLYLSEPPVRWVNEASLGSGAYGQVFKCHDTITGSVLAVKQVSVQIQCDVTTRVGTRQIDIQALRNKKCMHREVKMLPKPLVLFV